MYVQVPSVMIPDPLIKLHSDIILWQILIPRYGATYSGSRSNKLLYRNKSSWPVIGLELHATPISTVEHVPIQLMV